jgi:hypothetical protein
MALKFVQRDIGKVEVLCMSGSQFVRVSSASSVSVTGPAVKEQNPGTHESSSYGTKTNGAGYSMCELKRNRERERGRVGERGRN